MKTEEQNRGQYDTLSEGADLAANNNKNINDISSSSDEDIFWNDELAAEFAAIENTRRSTKKDNGISKNDVYSIEETKERK